MVLRVVFSGCGVGVKQQPKDFYFDVDLITFKACLSMERPFLWGHKDFYSQVATT